nr:MAG TPA: hypothetical protein [Caudoviricetes sp.]
MSDILGVCVTFLGVCVTFENKTDTFYGVLWHILS